MRPHFRPGEITMSAQFGKHWSSALWLLATGAFCCSSVLAQTGPEGFPEMLTSDAQSTPDELKPPIADIPPGQDMDKDGLLDSYEAYLLKKFAPKIWLH